MTATTIQKPTLRLGSRGRDVEELQRLLNHYNYSLPVDGIFGAWTEGCVKDYQLTHFLKNDGIVGNKTWRALYSGAPVDMPVLRRGSRQEEVRIVQTILTYLVENHTQFSTYYSGAIDSFYGATTENAVKAFQQNSGLAADGIVGEGARHPLARELRLSWLFR
ncbi:MAG: peptidoglycan-binding domain-containing protein [Thainema sp.]